MIIVERPPWRNASPDPKNVPGNFYVLGGCCTMCGVPEYYAPALFSSDEDGCFVAMQPSTPEELDAMIEVMGIQELGCIRYCGSNPDVIARLTEKGEGAQVDYQGPLVDAVAAFCSDHQYFEHTWLFGRVPAAFIEAAIRHELADETLTPSHIAKLREAFRNDPSEETYLAMIFLDLLDPVFDPHHWKALLETNPKWSEMAVEACLYILTISGIDRSDTLRTILSTDQRREVVKDMRRSFEESHPTRVSWLDNIAQ